MATVFHLLHEVHIGCAEWNWVNPENDGHDTEINLESSSPRKRI